MSVKHELNLSFLTSREFTSEPDWLNHHLDLQLGHSVSLSTIDQVVASTVNELELASSDTATLVDRAISDVSDSVDRFGFDLQLLRENALLVKFTLDQVRLANHGFTGRDSDVHQVVERVRELDLVKSRLEAARDVLREAESWSTLEPEVTQLVDDREFVKAAERLREAHRSMVVFHDTQEYEARRQLLVSLQNQLEQTLTSGLVKAIEQRDVKGLRLFYSIFAMIERTREFTQCYFRSRRTRLVEQWSEANLVDCRDDDEDRPRRRGDVVVTSQRLSNPDPVKFSHFVDEFYSDLVSVVSDERTYVPAIFAWSPPDDVLERFVESTLESLVPSFHHRLHAVSESYQTRALPELIDAFKATEQVAIQIERVVASATASATAAAVPPAVVVGVEETQRSSTDHATAGGSSGPPLRRRASTKQQQRSRSLSKRLSSSRSISFAVGNTPFNNNNESGAGGGGGTDHEGGEGEGGRQETRDPSSSSSEPPTMMGLLVRGWETSLFEPFLDFQVDYANLERRYLREEIRRHLYHHDTTRRDDADDDDGGGDWILDRSFLTKSRRRRRRRQRRGGGRDVDGTKVLVERVSKLFGLFDDACGRNVAFTHGYASNALVDVLDELWVEFVETRTTEVVSVSTRRHHQSSSSRRRQQQQRTDDDDEGEEEDDDESEEEAAGDDDDDADVVDDMVLEGLEYSSRDWDAFQFGLGLLDACRRIQDKLDQFEQRLKGRMTQLGRAVRGASPIPPGTTRGEIVLLRQSSLNCVELHSMFDKTNDDGSSSKGFLLPRSQGASNEFTRTAQVFLHEILLAPLLAHLSDYSTLACWTTTNSSSSSANTATTVAATTTTPGGKGAALDGLAIPTFSLSPTETISRVGEGLFNLPRLFEVYARDVDALAYSIETLPFVNLDDVESLELELNPLPPPEQPASSSTPPPPMIRQPSSSGSGGGGHHRATLSSSLDNHSPSFSHQHRSSISQSQAHISPAAAAAPPPSRNANASSFPLAARRRLSTETVIATWLSSLTLSVLSHLTEHVLSASSSSISRLSRSGADQLVSDLDYISNVARALDVESPRQVDEWRDCVAMDDQTLVARLREAQQLAATKGANATDGGGGGGGGIDREILERVAKIRGLRRG